VVVELGQGRGALVIWTAEDLAGSELEIRRAGEPADGTHVAVRPRDVASGRRYAAFFPSLAVGTYEVAPKGCWTQASPLVVEVGEGITEVRWPGDRPADPAC
jgi:hypothetical protein